MARFFRNKTGNFLWDEGAIVSNEHDEDGYKAISNIWDHVGLDGEYITAKIIESPDNADFFEEVWPIGKLEKMVFGNKKQAQAAAAVLYKGGK